MLISSLMDRLEKIKEWARDNKNDLMLAISFFLVAILSFGLGRLSVFVEIQRKKPIQIDNSAYQGIADPGTAITASKKLPSSLSGTVGSLLYVGSKNSDKYHLPDCPGALRIKEANKIWFSSKEEAENLGYTPASNCDGL